MPLDSWSPSLDIRTYLATNLVQLVVCLFLGLGSFFGTERVDRYLAVIHFCKFNYLLLTKFVCLYSKEIGSVSPSVAPSSAGLKLVSQLLVIPRGSVREVMLLHPVNISAQVFITQVIIAFYGHSHSRMRRSLSYLI